MAGMAKPQPQPFIFPHVYFQAFFKERRAYWEESILCSPEQVKECWPRSAQDPDLQSHPFLQSARQRRLTVPLGMHGDGGSCSKNDFLFTISWNSLLGSGITMRKRFVFTAIRKSQLTSGTLDSIWKVFAWSMNQLVRGEWSDTDWKGAPTGRGGEKLADNWRGALIQVRGDWEFYMQAFHFPQWNVGDIMCWMCRASNQHRDRLWTQFGPDAGWRQNMFTHATWIEYCLGKGKGVVLRGVGQINQCCHSIHNYCTSILYYEIDSR